MNMSTVVPWRCHICGTAFDEFHGGLCAACNRPTCAGCWGNQRSFLPGWQRTGRCKACVTLKPED